MATRNPKQPPGMYPKPVVNNGRFQLLVPTSTGELIPDFERTIRYGEGWEVLVWHLVFDISKAQDAKLIA